MTFAPLAWLKLQYFCHAGDTEVGGYAVTSQDNPFFVDDFQTVAQESTCLSVRFLDTAVAEFFDRCVDRGLAPQRFARIWCHTHPGASVTPSGTDEETFGRCFGGCDWAVMFILGRTGNTYARLSFGAGPGGQLPVAVGVDWLGWPRWLEEHGGALAGLAQAWAQEYAANVTMPPTGLWPAPLAETVETGEGPTDHPGRLWTPDGPVTEHWPEEELDAWQFPW